MRSEPNWQAVALTALVIAIVLLCVWMLWRFLPALAWAAVLAIATWPLRERLAGRATEATGAAAVLTLGLTLALIVPLAIVGVQIAREATQIVHWVHDLRETGIAAPDWIAQLPFVGPFAADWWQQHLADADSAKELLGRAEAVGIVHWTQLGSQLVGRLIVLMFTLLTLFFLYRDGPRVMMQSRRIAGRLFGPAAKKIGLDAVNAVRGTVNGLVLVGLAEGLIMGLAYVIAGVSHPLLYGFATAILATVPFGAPLVFVIASLTLMAASKVLAGALVLVFGFVVVFVADHFVRPVLIGNATRLPFLWVLLGIFGGLETFGLVGLFFGPAIISVVLSVWRDAVELSAAEGAAAG
jgi:predicted PurR-regulated permease PerM